MKKFIIVLLGISLFMMSCEEIFDTKSDDKLGGNTDIPLNTVGNTFDVSVYMNNSYLVVPSSATITKSDNGINTIEIVADLSQVPGFATINSLIPAVYKDSQGRVNLKTKAKVTSEGILTYMTPEGIVSYANSEEIPYIAVRYDCKVGDVYKMKKKDGSTMTRTVISKSTTDDYPIGFMYIKVIKIVEEPPYPGLSQNVYYFNHKFGFVGYELIADDGSKLEGTIFPDNY
ncbi:MAG: hypothetical protein U1C46_01240 [Bacteroidales bacterium]|nr:hypothetical protein [Bacteroidales bacterium]MDZ4203416.1 hypothetical protein [Bacteroidales bacterium]